MWFKKIIIFDLKTNKYDTISNFHPGKFSDKIIGFIKINKSTFLSCSSGQSIKKWIYWNITCK